MNIYNVDSWNRFEILADKWTKDGPNGPHLFRGQSNEDWELTPSLTRLFNDNGFTTQTAQNAERLILEEFQNRYGSEDDKCRTLKKSDLLFWWEVMQHYNTPTRLLDWSKSPYAALYFAISGCCKENGALFVMDAGHLQWYQSIRDNDLQTKSNLGAFQEMEKSLLGLPYKKSMLTITSPSPTDRMSAQKSSFTISTEILESHDITGNDIVFSKCINRADTKPSIYSKFIIPCKLKGTFEKQLKERGIEFNSIYPDSRIMEKDPVFFELINQILVSLNEK